MNRLSFRNFVWQYYPFILFFVLMFVMHLVMGLNGDDIRYAKVLSNWAFGDYIAFRYHEWSSRLLIESVLIVLARYNMIIWGIFDCVIYTFGLYYAIRFFNLKSSRRVAFLGVLLALMYPFHEMATAGWMATTLNYLWCFSFAVISQIPLLNRIYGEKTSKWTYAVSILALLYAVNQEQSCALIFGLNLVFLVKKLIKKEELDRYNVFVVLLSLASLIFIFTCPGNSIRFAAEASYWYPQYLSYGIWQKIYLGTIPTFSLLLEEKIMFPLFYLILSVTAITKVKNRNLKYVLYFNIAFILFLVFYRTCLDMSTIGSALNMATLSLLSKPLGSFVNMIYPLKHAFAVMGYKGIGEINAIAIFIVLYLFVSSCILLVYVFGNFDALVIFLAGFMSKFVTAFSPTVFASGPRTLMFFYFILIGLILMLIVKLYEDGRITPKWGRLMRVSFMILAGLNYLFVFSVVMVKYSIFI